MTSPKTAGATDAAPRWATAALVLADGAVFWGKGVGAARHAVGEVCFNTSMTGYQEIITDPSYAGQIITFTFPHIGNVGTNLEDIESINSAARGVRAARRHHRARQLAGGQAARRLAEEPRPAGHMRRRHAGDHAAGARRRRAERRAWSMRPTASSTSPSCARRAGVARARRHGPRRRGDDQADLQLGRDQVGAGQGLRQAAKPNYHVVAVDYGAKRNILRCLANTGCKVTVVPATATAEDILRHKPDGVFLSNGPGDPAATAGYSVPAIQGVLDKKVPLFGICLGHQILALTLGGKTRKMERGHRGANQPVKDLTTGKVENKTCCSNSPATSVIFQLAKIEQIGPRRNCFCAMNALVCVSRISSPGRTPAPRNIRSIA